jgi:rhomboid protease GluP
MKLRWLLREIQEFPATILFCLLWIVVFAAMVGTQLSAGLNASWTQWLLLGFGDGHRFGDLSLQDLARGEYWRLITSTFVHFSVAHLVLNLIAMYQLGTLVESWYGSPQAIFVYGVTGAGGNLISVLIRHDIGSNPRIHSGGGSVVIMGLVALCAVVGLRSRSELGMSMGRMMVGFMVATAGMGAAFYRFIDNWGHAGGALVGLALGFAHRVLLGAVHTPKAWGRGVFTAIVIAACGAFQVAADRREAPLREEQTALRLAAELERTYQILSRVALMVRSGGDTKMILKLLGALDQNRLSDPPGSAEVASLRALAEAADGDRLSADQAREFEARLKPLIEPAYREFRAQREKLWRVRESRRVQSRR